MDYLFQGKATKEDLQALIAKQGYRDVTAEIVDEEGRELVLFYAQWESDPLGFRHVATFNQKDNSVLFYFPEWNLSRTFVAILSEWLGDDLKEVKRLNRIAMDRHAETGIDPSVEHSHDFVDTNMAFTDAFAEVIGREFEGDDDDLLLYSKAYALSMPDLTED